MEKLDGKKSIGIDAILLALYFAITPIHQTLLLSGGATVTKYVAFAIMIVIVAVPLFKKTSFDFNMELFNSLGIIALWLALGIFYSAARNTTISALISIISYFALMIIVCSKKWTQFEKNVFKSTLTGACVYYSINLISSVSTRNRATIVSSGGIEADQNMIALNIGVGFLFALAYCFEAKKESIKKIMFIVAAVIIAGVICTGSRGGLVAIIAASVYYIYNYQHKSEKIKKRIMIVTVLMIIILLVLVNTNILGNEVVTARYSSDYEGDFFSGRFDTWGKYINLLIERPYGLIMGYGYGAVKNAAGHYMPATHNDILNVFCSGGPLTLYFFVKFVRSVWKKSASFGDILGRACMILVLVGGLSVDFYERYGWWNAMIFAYIGIGAIDTDGN